MPYNDKKKIIFLHIPKTGGTTIERLFNINLFHSSRPDERPSLQHLTCNMLCEKMGKSKYDSYYKFTFIRNPWARILSTYFGAKHCPRKDRYFHLMILLMLLEIQLRIIRIMSKSLVIILFPKLNTQQMWMTFISMRISVRRSTQYLQN